jgi:hypothetical protein
VNVGIYVAKPGLPLARLEPVAAAETKRRLRAVVKALEKIPNTRVQAASPEFARAQAILSMGGVETARYLMLAHRLGGDWRAVNRAWRA